MDKTLKAEILHSIENGEIKQVPIQWRDKFASVQYTVRDETIPYQVLLSRDRAGRYKIKMSGYTVGEIIPGNDAISAAEKIDIMDIFAAAERKFYTKDIPNKKVK